MQQFAKEMVAYSDGNADTISDLAASMSQNLASSDTPLAHRVAAKLTQYLAESLLSSPSSREVNDSNWDRFDLSPAQITSLTYQNRPPQNIISEGSVYDLAHHDAYMNAYTDAKKRKIIVSVRGTKLSDLRDIKADASIPLNKLVGSERYKSDTKTMRALMQKYSPDQWDYVLTGHSLGGAIVSALTREYPVLGIASSRHKALTYNSALQPEDLVARTSVKRHYASDDPLYKTGGFLAPGTVVTNKRAKSERTFLRAHALDNFY
jgi:hypothetical protein